MLALAYVLFHSTRVLSSSGQLGVPKVDKPRLTEPKPFKLRSDSRAQARKSHELPSLEQAAAAATAATFKAQPVKKSILDGPVRMLARGQVLKHSCSACGLLKIWALLGLTLQC